MVNKTCFISVIALCFIGFSGATQTFVPDDNFEQALIDLGYDSGPLDDFVPTANIDTITNLDVADKNISDLTGIQDFITLSILDCSGNQINLIDLTQNTNLTELYCFNNQITNLNVAPLTSLKILWCYQNLLTNINVSQNPNLISLVCGFNSITSLNVTQNQSLVVLAFDSNNVSFIDVSQNPNLNRLQCGNNLLTALDISKNLNLSYLSCEENQIMVLDTANNQNLDVLICYSNLLSELDISKSNSLTELNCANNNLCYLNLKNGNNSSLVVDFSLNNLLDCVVADNTSNIPSNWLPLGFSNYVTSQDLCSGTVNIDKLSDVVTNNSYILPVITNGNYFTESGGNGTPLFAGNSILTTQTIYIYNETACYNNETSFYVLITDSDYFIPKYFTPNDDGSHDVWSVIDNTNTINNITIYDQYGKFLKFLRPNSPGWDGTFNGKRMGTDDYWYVILLNTGEDIRGHFTLKR